MERAIKTLILISILLAGQQALAQKSPKSLALERRWQQMRDNVKTALEEVNELEAVLNDLEQFRSKSLSYNVTTNVPSKESLRERQYQLINLKVRLHRWQEKEERLFDELARHECVLCQPEKPVKTKTNRL